MHIPLQIIHVFTQACLLLYFVTYQLFCPDTFVDSSLVTHLSSFLFPCMLISNSPLTICTRTFHSPRMCFRETQERTFNTLITLLTEQLPLLFPLLIPFNFQTVAFNQANPFLSFLVYD